MRRELRSTKEKPISYTVEVNTVEEIKFFTTCPQVVMYGHVCNTQNKSNAASLGELEWKNQHVEVFVEIAPYELMIFGIR